jgi:hypothetical protein
VTAAPLDLARLRALATRATASTEEIREAWCVLFRLLFLVDERMKEWDDARVTAAKLNRRV